MNMQEEISLLKDEVAGLRNRVREIEVLASTDPLTGLANRRAGTRRLRALAAEYKRTDRSFGVIMLDMNGLKAINDSRGHAVGDRLLSAMSRVLENGIRPYDLAARWGGDEFLVLVADVDEQDLHEVSRRLRAGLSAAAIGAAMGVAMIRPGDEPTDPIKRADQAMREEKLDALG